MLFICSLSFEVWDEIFVNKDINIIFNFFLSTFVRLFYSYFSLVTTSYNKNDTRLMTPNIRTQKS
jgi:hypothetical protein